MSRASRCLGTAAALATLGCSDIGAPVRSDLYEWRIEAPAVPGPGLDTLSFHWGKNEQPVRIWVEDASGLPDHMARAIEVWESSFLYGEFDGTLVGDSAQADVIVRGGSAMGLSSFMPAWKGILKESEIQDLVAYIRSLALPPK